jgi:hypothetical protein
VKAVPVIVPELKDKQITVARDQQDTYNAYQALQALLPWRTVYSRWTFTEEERKAIAEGADLFFQQLCFGNPLQPINFEIAKAKSEEEVRELLNLREYEVRFIRFEDQSESTTVEEGEAKRAESAVEFPSVMINGLMFTWEQLINAPELADAKRYIERANGFPLVREVAPAQPQQPEQAEPTLLEVEGDGTKPETVN